MPSSTCALQDLLEGGHLDRTDQCCKPRYLNVELASDVDIAAVLDIDLSYCNTDLQTGIET